MGDVASFVIRQSVLYYYTTLHYQMPHRMFTIKTLSNFPTETGISAQNFFMANSISAAEVNFFKYSLESVHK